MDNTFMVTVSCDKYQPASSAGISGSQQLSQTIYAYFQFRDALLQSVPNQLTFQNYMAHQDMPVEASVE